MSTEEKKFGSMPKKKKKKRANVLDTVCFMLWAVVGAAIRDHWQL